MRSIFILFFILTATLYSAQNTVTCPRNKKVDLLIDKATAMDKKGESQKSIQIFQNAALLAKKSNCRESELMAQKGIMLCYARLYQYKKALAVSKTVEEIALRLKDYKILSSVFSVPSPLIPFVLLPHIHIVPSSLTAILDCSV